MNTSNSKRFDKNSIKLATTFLKKIGSWYYTLAGDL